jgi:hypothetical protein
VSGARDPDARTAAAAASPAASTNLVYDDLTSAERHVCEAVRTASIADFAEWTDGEPVLRGLFLRMLVTCAQPDWPPLTAPLRIRNARVTGPFGTPPQVAGCDSSHAVLSFSRCIFDEAVDFSGGEFLLLRFVDCEMPAFIGAGLAARSLDLSGSKFSGVEAHGSELVDIEACSIHITTARIGGSLRLASRPTSRFEAKRTVRLDGSRIEGELSLEGALLDGMGEPAFSARSVSIGGDASFTPAHGWRFKARGEVILAAARITGDLRFSGAALHNPSGRALHCEDLVAESISLSSRDGVPFVASGRINFLSATAGGMVFFVNARLWPGPDYEGLLRKGGPIAANLQQLRVSNALVAANIGALDGPDDEPETFTEHVPLEAWFLLAGAEFTSIVDSIDTGWPAPGYLELQGTSYVRIDEVAGDETVHRRLAWLARQFPGGQATADSYRSQPYEELSRVLRRFGRNREADAVAVEKIRQRLAARVDEPWARVFPNLLMLISRHGYSSSRAALSFGVFVAFGSLVYALALWGFGQPFVPIEAEAVPFDYRLFIDAWTASHARGCPDLMLPQYALDAALPLVELGQTETCRFSPEGPGAWAWSAFHTAYRLAGAALSAVVVLTLTGLLRRD